MFYHEGHEGNEVESRKKELGGRWRWWMFAEPVVRKWFGKHGAVPISNKKIIKNGEFEKFFNTEIPHFAVIFNYLSRSNILVAWEPKAFVYSSARDLACWYDKAFEVL